MDPTIIAISLVAGLIGLVVFFLLIKKKSSSLGNTILITGDTNSGKTALFYHLKTGAFHPTVSSLQSNRGTFVPKLIPGLPSLEYIDLPGHGAFRSQLPDILPSTRAIVFTIDATNTSGWPAIAQLLYIYLTNQYIRQSHIPIIITLTKTEEKSHVIATTKLQAFLTTELNKIQQANAGLSQLQSLGGDTQNIHTAVVSLFEPGASQFDFATSKLNLSWISVSAKSGDIDQLSQALRRAAQ